MYFSSQQFPVVEKDPTINKMRLDVFNAMENIIDKEFPTEAKQPIGEVRHVSFEDALKELLLIKQNKFV